MKIFTKYLWNEGEYTYETGTDFIPTLTAYLHSTKIYKPAILVVPGGGYNNVSPTEGEVVALKFIEKGYNAFLLTYTTKSNNDFAPVKYQALRDIAKAMVDIKRNADEWFVDTDKICTIGFSAGGHLVSALSVHHNKSILDDIKKGIDIKPKAQILSYPVISMTEDFAHQGSKDCLLGVNPTDEEALFMSTEKQVGEHTPPTFLWHCVDDASVDFNNSVVFAKEVAENGVQVDLHIFSYGSHGVSTCDESWVNTSYDLDSPTLQIIKKLVEKEMHTRDGSYIRRDVDLTNINSFEEFCNEMSRLREFKDITTNEYKHISKWVELAIEWLEVEINK